MGTTYTVRIVPGESEIDAEEIAAKIEKRLTQINQQVSTYIPSSEISKFNASRSTDWFAVSPETANVVQAAIDMYEQTNGAFDITVGSIIKYWGFGSGNRNWTKPDAIHIQEMLNKTGTKKLQCRLQPPAIKKTIPELEIDLSAIAKGDAVDQVCQLLTNEIQPKGYLVEIGGEIRVFGQKSDGSKWILAVESPTVNTRSIQTTFQKTDCAIATSGDYRNFIEIEGQRYSHTIDPKTGFPITHSLGSVTVLAKTCQKADALATSLMVMGPTKGYNWAEKNRIAVLFLQYEKDKLIERATSQYKIEIEN